MTTLQPTERTVMIGDAAMRVLAAEGSRGLTHRAVDRLLGFPEGTTSRYHRTRDSLMNAAVQRLVDVEVAHLEQWEHEQIDRPTTTISDVAVILRRVYQEWVDGSVRQIARYNLSLEGLRRPVVHDAIVAGRDRLNASIARLLEAIGCANTTAHATAVVSYIDGLCHDRLLHPEISNDPRDVEELFRRWLMSC